VPDRFTRFDTGQIRYEEAMKAEIDPPLSDNANRKTEDVINAVTGLYNDLFEVAKCRGAESGALRDIHSFIHEGMIRPVHRFSGQLSF
jgi:hypothetical protein